MPLQNEVRYKEESEQGTWYVVEGPLHTPNARPVVRTVWIVDDQATVSRLVTAYPIN